MAEFTENRADIFLDALAATCHVGKACVRAGLSREQVYNRRRTDPDFAKRYDTARELGVQTLEEEAQRRAFEGVDKPLHSRGQIVWRTVEVWDDDLEGYRAELMRDENGQLVPYTIKEYSDSLAMFLLKANDPSRYRENHRVDIANADDKPFETNDNATANRIAAILEAARQRRDADGPAGADAPSNVDDLL